MESVIAFARDGGLVLGICNGFQVLCEAGLLPGALLPNDVAALPSAARSTLEVVSTPTRRSRARARAGERLSIPVKHTTGRYYAPTTSSTGSRPPARSSCATRPGENPNGSLRDIAGVCNEEGNVIGLMPHPEHAVDALTGSADGLQLFAVDRGARVDAASPPDADAARPSTDAVALGLTRDEYALICEKLGREPNEVELAMFSLLWSEHCAYKHSKKLLRTLPTEGPARRHGPGRERRRGRRRRRPGVSPSRSSRTTTRARSSRSRARPPASAGSCATSSRSARGRSRCSTRCASASRRLGALALPARPRGRGHRPLRQLDRRADDRRRGLLRGALRDELPRQRDGARPRADASGSIRSAAAGVGNVAGPVRRLDRAATGSAARRCSPRAELGEDDDGQAPDRPGRRPVRGEEAARVLARAARARACSSRCRTSAPPA